MDEWAASKGEEEETEEKQIETLDSEPTALNFTVFMAIDVFKHGRLKAERAIQEEHFLAKCKTPAEKQVEFLRWLEEKKGEACRDWFPQSSAGRPTQYV